MAGAVLRASVGPTEQQGPGGSRWPGTGTSGRVFGALLGSSSHRLFLVTKDTNEQEGLWKRGMKLGFGVQQLWILILSLLASPL